MTTMMIEATDRNIKVANRHNVEMTIFGGYLVLKGTEKEVKRIARKVKALI